MSSVRGRRPSTGRDAIAPSAALYEAHRVETRDMSGNHSEEKRRMLLRHEKAIADMQEKQEREMSGAPRWRKI